MDVAVPAFGLGAHATKLHIQCTCLLNLEFASDLWTGSTLFTQTQLRYIYSDLFQGYVCMRNINK